MIRYNETKLLSVPTENATIYIAGDLAMAKEACRKLCAEVGLCVRVVPCTYIYTGGEEEGLTVHLINYPRFPESAALFRDRVARLADYLLQQLHQKSCTVEHGDLTTTIMATEVKVTEEGRIEYGPNGGR